MKTIQTLFLLGSLAAAAAPVNAEEMQIPAGQQGQHLKGITVPQSGITMDAVKQQFGEPSSVSQPVGDPPITRWNYDKFTVYFEHNRVIHSVLDSK